MRRIAEVVGRGAASVSRQLACLGLSRLKALDLREPVVCHEHLAAGELLHMDTKNRAYHRSRSSRHGRSA